MASKGVAVAGNIIVDTIKTIDAYPDKLELTVIRSMSRALGGLVCNVGIDLARLDPELPVMAIGFAGEDENGELVMKEFGRYPSLDTSCVWREGITSFTDVMTVGSTGERTFFTYKGADSLLTPERLACAPLEKCALLHIGYQLLLEGMDAPDEEYGTAMARALHDAQQRGLETSFDVVSEKGGRFRTLVPPSLKYVDHLAVNEYEAAQITGVELIENGKLIAKNLPKALEILRSMGVKKRVVIHTPLLAAGLDESDALVLSPALKLPDGYIKGSVGAGDAFTAGLLYETMQGSSLETALRSANAVAACSLSAPGSTEGVPTMKDVLKLYEALPVHTIPTL